MVLKILNIMSFCLCKHRSGLTHFYIRKNCFFCTGKHNLFYSFFAFIRYFILDMVDQFKNVQTFYIILCKHIIYIIIIVNDNIVIIYLVRVYCRDLLDYIFF